MIPSAIENDLLINVLHTQKAALVYRAINHQLRQQMLCLLHEKKRMTVTGIYVELNLEQPVASQHLAILREAGIVNTQREGKKIFYSVNYNRIAVLHQKAKEISAIERME